MSNNDSLPNTNKIKQGSAQGALPQANSDNPTGSTDPHVITAHSAIQRVAHTTIFDNIPADLRALPQWCLAASSKDKAPRMTNGHHASSTDRSTWTDFQTARTIAEATGQLIGFVLTADDPFACVDADVKDCNSVDKKTGQLLIEPEWSTEDDLAEYINFISASESYTEISASGKGTHTWFNATVGRGRKNARWEVYDRERFIICTGRTVKNIRWDKQPDNTILITAIREGAHPIRPRQVRVDGVLHDIGQSSGGELAELEELPPTKPDEAIMESARNADNAEKFNRLYSGDINGYPSASEADHALAELLAFHSKSNEQVRRLFLASKLGERDKHHKNNGYHLNLSLQKIRAIQATEDRKLTAFSKRMEPAIDNWIAKHKAEAKNKAAAIAVSMEANEAALTVAIDATQHSIHSGNRAAPAIIQTNRRLQLLTDNDFENLPSESWIVKNLIPTEAVGVISGKSGSYKSFLALDLFGHISNGKDWFGHRVMATPTVYVPFEGRGGIPKRVKAWKEAFGPTWIHYLMEPINLRLPTDREALVQTLHENGLAGGVLCIDTLAAAAGEFDENSGKDMAAMLEIITELQHRLGGVVVVVHHLGKDPTKGLRGHSSLSAAIDFDLLCKSEGGLTASWTAAKVKDEESGGEHKFNMLRHDLGIDEDGDPITSLTVSPTALTTDSAINALDELLVDADFIFNWVKEDETTQAPEAGKKEWRRPSNRKLQDQRRNKAMENSGYLITKDRLDKAVKHLLQNGKLFMQYAAANKRNPYLTTIKP